MARVKKTRNLLGRNLGSVSRPDTMSTKVRSSLMSKIRSSNTKLETKFIESLSAAGIEGYELQARDIIGRPDVVFRSQNVCVFIDSNFWHGWQFPRWKHKMSKFWVEKIEKNRARDVWVARKLRKEGWKVIRIWEHQIVNKPEGVLDRVKEALK